MSVRVSALNRITNAYDENAYTIAILLKLTSSSTSHPSELMPPPWRYGLSKFWRTRLKYFQEYDMDWLFFTEVPWVECAGDSVSSRVRTTTTTHQAGTSMQVDITKQRKPRRLDDVNKGNAERGTSQRGTSKPKPIAKAMKKTSK